MCPCFRKNLILASFVTLLLSGCHSSIKTGNMSHVDGPSSAQSDTQSSQSGPVVENEGGMPAANKAGERYDGNAEEEIAKLTVQAWRTALSHDKRDAAINDKSYKTQRQTDEKAAMDQLDAVEKRFPSQSTVLMMKGQVLEHFGKHEEAIKFYKKASERNLVNSMSLFKAAEAERKSGHTDDAIEDYRKLLTSTPGFSPAKMGLAQSLLKKDPASAEAKTLLNDIVTAEPNNEEAKKLLSQVK